MAHIKLDTPPDDAPPPGKAHATLSKKREENPTEKGLKNGVDKDKGKETKAQGVCGVGDWWRFDDETVSKMARGPLSSPSDHGIAPTSTAAGGGGGSGTGGKKGRGGKGGKRKKVQDSDDDEDYIDDDSDFEAEGMSNRGRRKKGGAGRKGPAAPAGGKKRGTAPCDPPPDPNNNNSSGGQDVGTTINNNNNNNPSSSAAGDGEITSANAYLLVYRLRGAELDHVDLGPAEAEW